MKMSDVKRGMTFMMSEFGQRIVVVTELTDKGFKYKYVDGQTISIHPRLGLTMAAEGHEHYGLNGEVIGMIPVGQMELNV